MKVRKEITAARKNRIFTPEYFYTIFCSLCTEESSFAFFFHYSSPHLVYPQMSHQRKAHLLYVFDFGIKKFILIGRLLKVEI